MLIFFLAKVEAGEDPSVALGNREESGGEDNELGEMLEELFASVMTVTDAADPDRLLHLMFRLLPSQKRYPEYYKMIENPLDLKSIATKIVENKYTTTAGLEVCITFLLYYISYITRDKSLLESWGTIFLPD